MNPKTDTRPPPMCRKYGVVVKNQEPDNWTDAWLSWCDRCEQWNRQIYSEKANRI